MKKLICFLLAAFCFFLTNTFVFAQEDKIISATPAKKKAAITATPTPKSKIDEIKEKIASTVAQLNLVSKRGFVGELTKLEKSKMSLEKNGEVQIVDVDELTKYVSVGKDGKRVEIAFKDLGVEDNLVAIGLYNKESRKLLARVILVKEIPININGIVREVDIKDGTLTVENKKRSKTYIVDIEKTTLIRKYVMAEGLTKSGLSKIEIGERIHVNGMRSEEEESRLAAKRVLLLPGKAVGITTSPGIKQATEPATPTEKPTVTLKPTKKPVSPTPTSTETP